MRSYTRESWDWAGSDTPGGPDASLMLARVGSICRGMRPAGAPPGQKGCAMHYWALLLPKRGITRRPLPTPPSSQPLTSKQATMNKALVLLALVVVAGIAATADAAAW